MTTRLHGRACREGLVFVGLQYYLEANGIEENAKERFADALWSGQFRDSDSIGCTSNSKSVFLREKLPLYIKVILTRVCRSSLARADLNGAISVRTTL